MAKKKLLQEISSVTVCFAGDSGDGMQLTGLQFTDTSALMGNDVSTLPEFPAEIRAPIGTLPGVSSFQIQFADTIIYTPGDLADVLVAMNPAALKVEIPNVKPGGLIIVNEDAFTDDNLNKANWSSNPLLDKTLKDFQILKVPLTTLTRSALQDSGLKHTEVERCKNFFALGFTFWLYDRTLEHTIQWIHEKFSKRPEIAEANVATLRAGYNYADISEAFAVRYQVKQAPIEPGTYRKVTGSEATSIGLVTASLLAETPLFYASYPITPASDILQELAANKRYGVKTFQAEDEIAACGAALGASFGGLLGVTGTSGPGMCLKAEMVGLAVMAELPLVIVDVQRAGPSTGMPTKPEQGDLLMSLFGRHGESPIAVLAAKTPSECFTMALEAVRIAVKHMTPVILLLDGYLANSSAPWKLPNLDELPKIKIVHPIAGKDKFQPYDRDPETLARFWAVPGTPGLEHRIGGLGKADITGMVSNDPDNNQKMVNLRAEKVRCIANDIPALEVRGPRTGKLLVLGWGSTYGTIYQALTDIEKEGVNGVAHAHLSYLNPFPPNLGEVLKNYETILIPELNSGQLLVLIRYHFPLVKTEGLNKVQGQPFKVVEVVKKIKEML
jgi:2-oxoglutarate ferredoxin oxidoreductase subunit alpha